MAAAKDISIDAAAVAVLSEQCGILQKKKSKEEDFAWWITLFLLYS